MLNRRRRYRRKPRPRLKAGLPGVSILRPLKGLDTNLYDNLESSFRQSYDRFELLLSVAHERDQALTVCRDLVVKYPHVDATIIIGDVDVGINPKVNNLVKSYHASKFDILWVIDSNVCMDSDALKRSVESLESNRIGLVHHVPLATGSEISLGSRIETAFLNTNHAKMYIALNTVALDSCVVGKSNLYRKSQVECVNGSLSKKPSSTPKGLASFGRFLAEDNMIGAALWHELDLRHDLSSDVAHSAVGPMTLSDYIWRRVRWIRVRKHMVLAATIVEPFTESIVMAIIGTLSLRNLFQVSVPVLLMLALTHFIVGYVVDLDVRESLAGQPLPAHEAVSFLQAWLLREVLALPIFCLAICGDQVSWRGKNYTVKRGGEIAKATDYVSGES